MARSGRPLKVHPDLELLFHIVRDEPVEKIRKILDVHGIDAFDYEKRSALNCAAFHQRIDVVDDLVAAKADLNFQDKDGWTSLHHAVGGGSLEAIEHLIAAGAEIDRPDEHGNTALLNAVVEFQNNPAMQEIIQALLKAGAGITRENNYGVSPFSSILDTHYAVLEGEAEAEGDLFFLLTEEDKKQMRAYLDKKSPFELLGDHFHDELKHRITNGLDVNMVTADGNSLLAVAALYAHTQSMKLLLEHGANLEQKAENGMTPLAFAASANVMYDKQWKCVEAVDLLLANGADIHVKDKNGMTILALAAAEGRWETVEYLLAKDLDVNAKDQSGKTVLDHGKKSFNKEHRKKVVNLLKKKGAV